MAKKTYRDLKAEVWDLGRCAGCGACVAVCPVDAFYFQPGALQPDHTDYCKEATDGVPCSACYEACPRVIIPSNVSSLLGDYRSLLSAKAGFEVPGRQSGGAVTAILLNALEAGVIDAVVTVTEDRWTHRPSSAVITSTETLLHQAGSRYNWWVPLMAALKEAVLVKKFRRVAVVGVPCVVQAVHRIRQSENELLRPFCKGIRLVIGLFCTESFDYRELMEHTIERIHHIESWRIQHLNVKGALEVTLDDGSSLNIPLSELKDCTRKGCQFCSDFAAEEADISAGAVGSKEGFTTLILRNALGQGFVESAIRSGRLLRGDEVDKKAIERLASQKQKRAR